MRFKNAFFVIIKKHKSEKKRKISSLVLFKNKTKLGNCTMDKNLKKNFPHKSEFKNWLKKSNLRSRETLTP